MNRRKTLRVVQTGVSAALFIVLAQIQIPLPSGVPITLQTFAAALCGYTLGPAFGTAAVLTYLMLGLAGLPVFAGFAGGAGVLLGVTGGYLWGFLPFAALCGAGRGRKRLIALMLGLLGLFVCHLFGTVQFGLLSGAGVWTAFLTASASYLIKDVLSVAAAYGAAEAVRVALRRSGVFPDR